MNDHSRNDHTRYSADDEISLVDLWCMLVEKKVVFLSVVITTLLATIAYLILVAPTYEAKLRLLLPSSTTLSLSNPDHPYALFEAKTVFQDYQGQIKRIDHWRRFISANPDLFPADAADVERDLIDVHPIRFSRSNDYPAEHVEVTYRHQDPEVTAAVLRGYLQFAHDAIVSDLMDQIENRIDRRQENIVNDIALMRHKARMAREDEIERLRQDITLASALGITDNMLLRFGVTARESGSDITILTSNETVRSYMRGTRTLQAELEALLERESDDPFISDLLEKQIELERLRNLQVTPARFRAYSPDGEIVVPQSPVKPRKLLVLALGIVLGLMLGVFAVFMAWFVAMVRERT